MKNETRQRNAPRSEKLDTEYATRFSRVRGAGGFSVTLVKKTVFLLFLAAIALVTALCAWQYSRSPYRGTGYEQAFAGRLEDYVRASFPFKKQFLSLGDTVFIAPQRRELFSSGSSHGVKQNGIFVSENGLMKNIDPPIDAYVNENIAGITSFAEAARENGKQTYVMILPTSGAIMQRYLPRYAQSVMVNQRQFINDAYSRLSGGAISIDAYLALLNRQNSYIYYRTENNLTALGGYYVYSAMLSRLGLGQAELNQFDIDYADNLFYGDLYGETGYTGVLPDSISLFRYNSAGRTPHEFLVTQKSDRKTKTYHTLFPTHMRYIGHELDVYLGGLSSVTDIYASTQYNTKLLVFGDKTAISYLPFLANNCGRLTFVDLFYGQDELREINPLDYDKIIFAYGIESFMHTNNPARAVPLLTDYE